MVSSYLFVFLANLSLPVDYPKLTPVCALISRSLCYDLINITGCCGCNRACGYFLWAELIIQQVMVFVTLNFVILRWCWQCLVASARSFMVITMMVEKKPSPFLHMWKLLLWVKPYFGHAQLGSKLRLRSQVNTGLSWGRQAGRHTAI